MRTLTALPVSAERFDLGEGCRWDARTGRLGWVDVFAGRLLEADWDGQRLAVCTSVRIPGALTGYAPLADRSGWIVAENQGISLLSRAGALRALAAPESGKGGRVRMNDAACDPCGRFWAGSMAFDAAPGAGSLYRLGADGGCTRVLTDLTISNGIGWSPDGRTMYHVDSGAGTVFAYDYDAQRGTVAARRALVVLTGDGVPDGLCVDADGYLWVAVWGAGEVHRYAPDGALAAVVGLAASQPSSCALGGADGRHLFVTTARHDAPGDVLARQPDAGRVFAVAVDVPGLPIQPFLGAGAGSGATG